MDDDLTAAHVAWMRGRNLAAGTIRRRLSVLATLAVDPATATRADLEAWWTSRADHAPATRAADLTQLRGYYRWLVRFDHRPDDPTIRLDAPRLHKGLPRPAGKADVDRLLATLPADLARGVALGAYAGLRAAEAAGLGWDDVDLDTRRARVTGKGGKTRLVALGVVLIDLLLPAVPGTNVVTGTPRAMSPDAFQRRINRSMQAAGVAGTFHQLRHRYGTLAYQATRDLVAVGQQMGHSSPVTTSIYAAASDDAADVIADAVAR